LSNLTRLYRKSPQFLRWGMRRAFYRWLTIRSTISFLMLKNRKISNVNMFERKIFSQLGEDGIIRIILHKIGTLNKFCVEFGVGDGTECNTRYLVEKQGYESLWMDGSEENSPRIRREFITAENVNSLFAKYAVPKEFDLLSIDIDYNTYWVWRALNGYSPRMVVIEYNGFILPSESKAVPYSPDAVWDGTTYFGASLLALVRLGQAKGYTLVGCDSSGTDAFFVRDDLIQDNFVAHDIDELWKPAAVGHPFTDRPFVDV
jgi:hypothetical protein